LGPLTLGRWAGNDLLFKEVENMPGDSQDTRLFKAVSQPLKAAEILQIVYKALQEKGYDPVNQIVGYLQSGDPTFITREVRGLLRSVERDEILEELVRYYINKGS
jgi:uncharacterized protein (UPF0297 family)